MAFSQEMLELARNGKTLLDSIKAAVDRLVAEERISPQAAAEIKAAFSGNNAEAAEIEAALTAVPPPPAA